MNLTRRTLLKAAPFLVRAASYAASKPDRAADSNGRILVVLQLAGGNDGLNTVIPYEDDQYGRARTTLRLTGSQVHKIGASSASHPSTPDPRALPSAPRALASDPRALPSDPRLPSEPRALASGLQLGLHPALDGMARLYKEGHLSIVQGVGYPNMHRDHNIGMLSWQTASPAASLKTADQTGWLGRVADRCGVGLRPASSTSDDNVPVTFVGQIPPPLAVSSREAVVPAIREAKDWTLTAPSTLFDTAAFAGARRTSEVLKSSTGNYPDLPLAQSFQTVAQLIRADLGIRIYLVEQGGASPGEFDNHANQAVNHAVSLRELSQSMTAFCDDLARDHLLDRVLLMTFSEFGRTLSENGRHGTGHGAAAPVFLAGGRVKGGLIGAHPSLTDLDNDALKPHTDFRSLYATVLESWLGIPADPILGAHFPSIAFV